MARSYINLTYTISVSTTHDSEYIPLDCEVTETISLQFPSVDPKYTVPPAKLVEGVTERVITEHRGRVRDYFEQKTAREKDERQIGLWAAQATADMQAALGPDVKFSIEPGVSPEEPAPSSMQNSDADDDDTTPTGISVDDPFAGDDE